VDARREPVVGPLHALRLEPRPQWRAGPPAEHRDARPWWIAGAAAIALLVLLLLARGPLGDRFWPQARVHELGELGAQALAQGRLTASDGTGARELFEAALAMDPDRGEPRAGLARVATAALVRARADLEAGRLAEARLHLQLAGELSAPRAQVEVVASRLREREAAMAGIDGLMARAAAAHEQGQLHGDDDAALPLYARVLELQPAHAQALRGRDEALAAMLDQARRDLRGGELAAAASAIAVARDYDPAHVDLPDTEARLTEELDILRASAERDLGRGRIDAAVAAWRRLQTLHPDDAGAAAGLRRAATAHAGRATRLAADFSFGEATVALERARALAADAPGVAAATAALERAQRRHARLQAPASAGERARLPQLLRQAAEAEARGDLLGPPGESAYDRLRAAQAIDPRDPGLQRAIARLLPSARACFERGLSANNLAQARRCLDARDALGEDPRALAEARRRLAQRWLAIGDERLGAGQLDSAAAALASARALDAQVPGLAEFQQRLRIASRE
jgi:tetratricopeptide (TPR) repeat protein